MSDEEKVWCLDCFKDVEAGGDICPECGAPKLTQEEADNV